MKTAFSYMQDTENISGNHLKIGEVSKRGGTAEVANSSQFRFARARNAFRTRSQIFLSRQC
jgi:hypothetical protein